MSKLQYLRHYTLQKFGNNFLTMLIPFLNVHSWKCFSITSIILIKILRLLLKVNNRKILVLVCRKPTDNEQYLHYSCHHQKSCEESASSFFLNRAYSLIRGKDDLTKENARIKQMLQEN